MQKIKKLLGICDHEFKVARTQKIFIPDGDCRLCVGVRTEFDIVCQKCGECNEYYTNITKFSKPINYQEDPDNYSLSTQDKNQLEFDEDLKLKQLKHKYKIK